MLHRVTYTGCTKRMDVLTRAVLFVMPLIVCACPGPVEPNASPSAQINSPTGGSEFVEGDAVTFRGSASDPEDGTLSGSSLVWTSTQDGELGTGTLLSRSDLSVGAHTIALKATDSDGSTGTAQVSITIAANQPPVVTISTPADGAVYVDGDEVTLTGSATDPEDGTLSGSSLVWSSSRHGDLGTGTALSRSDLSVGDHTITLTATDTKGSEGTAQVSVTIVDNQVPVVTITSPSDGAEYVEGDEVTFNGSASDPEDGVLTGSSLVWSSNLDGELGTGAPLSRSDLSVGAHTITLTATDSKGNVGTTQVSITVDANQAPTTIIDEPEDGNVFLEGEAVTLTGSAIDPEDGTLSGSSVIWSSDRDGEIGTGTSLTLSTLSVGEHSITLTATDSKGSSASANVSLTVTELEIRTVTESTVATVGSEVEVALEIRRSDATLPVLGVNGVVTWESSLGSLVAGTPAGALWGGNLVTNEDSPGELRFAGVAAAGVAGQTVQVLTFSVQVDAPGVITFLPTLSELQLIDPATGDTVSLLGAVHTVTTAATLTGQ